MKINRIVINALLSDEHESAALAEAISHKAVVWKSSGDAFRAGLLASVALLLQAYARNLRQ